MKHILLPLMITALLLSACALPIPQAASPTPSDDQLATQVSQLLTSMPSTKSAPIQAVATQIPVIVIPTATQIPVVVIPTATPTASSLPTATETVAPTPTTPSEVVPTSTSTQSPTLPPPATDPKLKLGNPTFQDSFANGLNWPTEPGKFTNISIANNSLQLTGLSSLDGWRLTWPTLNNFYYEATIKPGNCSTTDRYGLIARVPDKNTASQGYLFGLSCDGKYSLRKWDGKNMIELVPWTASDAILSGPNQANRLGLLAVGNQLTVYINGTPLKSIQNSAIAGGYLGIFIGANKTQNFTINVTDLNVWENPNL